MTTRDATNSDNESPRPAVKRGVEYWPALGCLVIALVVSSVTVLRYAPRYTYWRGVHLNILKEAPEYGRAVYVLQQVHDPWVALPKLHAVIRWRLLFPLLWHYLRLPPDWLLIVPHIGCVIVLWLSAWLTYRRTHTWGATILAVLLVAPLPWFFVSCGWLGYFDSWLMLGLFVASFANAPAALAAACLLTPWVDERFVLALPLVLIVRAAALGYIPAHQWRDLRVDLLVACAATAPYVVIRAIAWWRGDAATATYIYDHLIMVSNVSLGWFVAGFWFAYRAAWLVLAVGIVCTVPAVGLRWAALLAVAMLILSVGGLFIAFDMSRTLMIVCPVLLLGVWTMTQGPKSVAWLVPAIAVANFLLPAEHALWFKSWPIRSLPTEWQSSPEPFFKAGELMNEANQLFAINQLVDSRLKLDEAITIYPYYPEAYLARAFVRGKTGDKAGYEADVGLALRLRPDYADALLFRASIALEHRAPRAAIQALEAALAAAPAGWPYRELAARSLQQAKALLAVPAGGQPPARPPF